MITYPVSSSLKFVLYRKSTQEVIIRNQPWPTADGSQIVGLNPDYAWLEMRTGIMMDYDPRYFSLVKTETPDITNEIWQTDWTTLKRDIPDIEVAVKNVENNELLKHFPVQDQIKLITLSLGVIFRQLAGQTLTAKETILANKTIALAAKLWQNDAVLNAKISAINAGQQPDLDTDWVL